MADQDDFTFDPAGRILTATKGRYANSIAYGYDRGGRIASESLTTDGQTYTIGRGYDDAGNLDELVYPDGTVVDRPHDARGLLDRVDYAGSLVADFQYDAGGRETTRAFGNGLVTTTSYVPDENLLASLATPGVGTYSYGYDQNKNRTAEAIGGAMSGYGYDTGPSGYDAEDRLVNWDRADGGLDQSWDLSAAGDWDGFTENATTETRAHNAVHELTGIDGAGLTYDPKGNLTADHLGRSFVWDADNMLTSCTVAAGASVGMPGTHGYAYDAIGRRVSKTVDGGDGTFATTVFAQLTLPIPPLGTVGGQVLAEYAAGAAAASPERSYAFGEYCDEPLTMVTPAERYYYHRDGRYSVVALTDSLGTVAERSGYDPYGDSVSLDATGAVQGSSLAMNRFAFTGCREDVETHLQHYCFRYRDARLGRFVSRDPSPFTLGDALHLYEYCLGDPLTRLDPAGTTSMRGFRRGWNNFWGSVKRIPGEVARVPGLVARVPGQVYGTLKPEAGRIAWCTSMAAAFGFGTGGCLSGMAPTASCCAAIGGLNMFINKCEGVRLRGPAGSTIREAAEKLTAACIINGTVGKCVTAAIR